MNKVTQSLPASVLVEAQRDYLMKVYAWMVGGLMLTGLTALVVASSEAFLEIIFSNTIIFFGLIIGQFLLVGTLSARLHRMSVPAAAGAFLLYSFLNGLTLSVIFLRYSTDSLSTVFFITAGTFGAMSLYGFVTRRDLSSLGSFMFMGLIGIILASIVNFFLQSSALYFAVSVIGVLIFTVLTAVDTQRLKESYVLGSEVTVEGRKIAIIGALKLYLDFINLFLFLLRLLGGRR